MQIAINAKNFQIQNPLWMLALQLLLVRMPNVSNDIKKKKINFAAFALKKNSS